MFKLFKKRQIGLKNRVKFISENKNINFQLDMLINDNLHFQMTRQKSLEKIGFNDFENPDDIVFSLRFNEDDEGIKINKILFLRSPLSKESIKIDLLGGTYLIYSKNDYESMFYTIEKIGREVYNHNYFEDSAIIFNMISG